MSESGKNSSETAMGDADVEMKNAAAADGSTGGDVDGASQPAGETTQQSSPAKAPPSVAEGGTPVPGSALSAEELDRLTEDIIGALKTVYDPEIPCDIYELGLIYRIDIGDERQVDVDMTLTAPGCPVAGDMPGWVENAVGSVPGVGEVKVNLVFDPPWDMSRMSDEARLAIGMFQDRVSQPGRQAGSQIR